MKIAVVECLLRVVQKGDVNNLSVPKAGPDALLVTEIPVLRVINDIEEGGAEDCCISEVVQTRIEDVTKSDELNRLREKYGEKLIQFVYPGGRGFPTTVEECELPSSAMAKAKPKAKAAAA